jgi:hypothetical protein
MSIPKTTKIFIAITIFILLIAIVFLAISKSKSTPASPISTETSSQTAPALPQATSGASNQAAPASSPSTSQNSAPGTTTPPIQAPSESFAIEKQADYSYDTIKANPLMLSSIQKAKSDFQLEDIGVSFPVATSKMKNGDEIILLSGCTPHFCGGSEIVIAYNKADKKSYVFKEKIGSGVGYEIFGNPSEETKNMLVYYFLNQ